MATKTEETKCSDAMSVRQAENIGSPATFDAVSLSDAENPLTIMTALIAFCSSIHTAAVGSVAEYFGCTRTLSTLGVSTFLLGFGSGPLVFAPLSEIYGRNPIYRTTLFLFLAFNLGCAFAPSIEAFLVFRFFCGYFGSPTGWFPGLQIQPFRDYWLVLILGACVYAAMFIFLPETYQPRLLQEKAQRLGVSRPQQSLKVTVKINLARPCIMFFTEPILFLLSLYMAFVYGILYLDFTAYPYVFQNARHWSAGLSGLSFLGIGVGMAIATASSPYINRIYDHFVKRLGGPMPEARLPHLIILSVLIPIGLFWFAWTASPSVHWASCIIAGIPFGIGFVTLFLGLTSYLIDCYGQYNEQAGRS
ncbi:hypothetical protein DL768_006351 [Monosporascus sp. mg162]|nr:hypothetical protein DL768_006351 [Monosporascus sp. mg162]